MPVFAYQATDRHGKLITGKIDAEEKQQVVTVLQKQNVLPIQIKQEKGFYPSFSSLSFSNPFKEASNNDIMIFTRQLSTLLISGITLDKSLFILTDLTEKEKLRDIIKTVREKVHGGSTFADALTKYPKIFTRLFINMVRVGEAGGVLGEVTERLSDFLEKTQKLKENIQSAMVYPALLALIGGSAVVVLMIFVIPKFAIIFSDMGQTIPLAAAVLIGLSSFVSNYWWIVLFFIILSCYMGWRYIRTPQGKFKWDTWVLEIPYIGSLVRKIEISRFCRTFGTLIKSGVPVLQSLLIVKEVINNRVISQSLKKIHSGVKVGKGISGPLKESNSLPPLAIHMISIGEETGNLEEMLFKVSDIYDNEIEVSIKNIIALIGPLLILMMACIVGFIVLSLLTAIFSVNEIPF